jgi:hypothetical protein
MDDVIVVENIVSRDCRLIVHLMSNREFEVNRLACYGAPDGTRPQVTREAGVYHLRAEWPYRGVLDVKSEFWPKAKRLVAWSLIGEEGAAEAILKAVGEFDELFGRAPGFIFVKKSGDVEHGKDLFGMIFLETEWMLENCVAVGGW